MAVFAPVAATPHTPTLVLAPSAPAAPTMPFSRTPAAADPVDPAAGAVKRETYDAKGSEFPKGGLGTLVRKEGSAASGDVAVDAAHDNAGIVHDFYKQVLGRDSIDGAGMVLKSVVHYGKNFNNAYWDGEKMTYGDGDGKVFKPLSQGLDVVGHEMTHGVTERTSGLNYQGQSGALNESWSDVFGELIEQWHENKAGFSSPDGAKAGDWLIGEDVFTPGTAGDALRSMKSPGTAYKGDPQPGNMKDYKKMSDDNGGVHVNSGIPNKAAYEAAVRIGGEKVAKVWYKAMTDYLRSNATFADAANATLSAAKDLYGEGDVMNAIKDAWTGVGIVPKLAKLATSIPVTVTHHDEGPAGGVVPEWLRDGLVQPGEIRLG
jgi:Zn-dependent metalloprotease